MSQSVGMFAGLIRTLLNYRATNIETKRQVSLDVNTKLLDNVAFELNDNIRKKQHANNTYIQKMGDFQGIPLFIRGRTDITYERDVTGSKWLEKEETGILVSLLEIDGNINTLEFNVPISLFY